QKKVRNMITENAERNEVSQENNYRCTFSSGERKPAVTATSPKGEIEHDHVPAGASRAGRTHEENCARKSRRMQDVLAMMPGVWVA
ncbi:MAG: hypothetical protein LUP97_07535, partial [Methanoregula sp.]|nr:hypothetical protein [Methanoregula sp.]